MSEQTYPIIEPAGGNPIPAIVTIGTIIVALVLWHYYGSAWPLFTVGMAVINGIAGYFLETALESKRNGYLYGFLLGPGGWLVLLADAYTKNEKAKQELLKGLGKL